MSIDSSDLRKIQKAYEKVKDAKILDYPQTNWQNLYDILMHLADMRPVDLTNIQ